MGYLQKSHHALWSFNHEIPLKEVLCTFCSAHTDVLMGHWGTRQQDLHTAGQHRRKGNASAEIHESHPCDLQMFSNTDLGTPVQHIWAFYWVKHLNKDKKKKKSLKH